VVDGDWLATGVSEAPQEYGQMEVAVPAAPGAAAATGAEHEYADLESFEEDNLASGDSSTARPAAAQVSAPHADAANDQILRTRTYDMSVTYDKFYQVPRLWLQGFDESGKPLPPTAVFEDISEDYRNRTVTVEAHPHMALQCASIHPCRHAPTMKKIFDNLTSDGSEARVDMALFVFLKFISSVVPTIEGDFTTDVAMKSEHASAAV
jgi:ubiquitin-like-conjugating enzyme ATG3